MYNVHYINNVSDEDSRVRVFQVLALLVVFFWPSMLFGVHCVVVVDQVVLHYERGEEANIFQDLEIALNRRPGKGLGLSLVGRRDGVGVFVSALVSCRTVLEKLLLIVCPTNYSTELLILG